MSNVNTTHTLTVNGVGVQSEFDQDTFLKSNKKNDYRL